MITGFYAGIFALVYVGLTLFVVKRRTRHKVGLGDGGVDELQQAIRIHGNFSEYVPFALLLIFLLELSNGEAWLLHSFGIVLIIGRILHFFALQGKVLRLRQAGMMLTLSVYILCSLILVFSFIAG